MIRLRKQLTYALPLLLVLGIGCGQSQDKEEESARKGPRSVLVDARKPNLQTVKETIEVVGSLKASRRTMVSSEIAGKIEKIHFEEGESVPGPINGTEEAPILVSLDDDLLQVERQEAEASLESARSELEKARDQFQRQKMMHEKGATTEAEFTRSKIEVSRARAAVKQAEARLERAKERLSKTKIRAPFAGELGERLKDEGSFVRPGDALVEVVKRDPIEVTFDIPEKHKSQLRKGQTVNVRVEAFPDETRSGSVFYLSPSVSRQSRTITAKARLSNPEGKLNPNMFARVHLVTNVRHDAPVVSDTALVPRNNKKYIYTVSDGKAHIHQVQIGQRFDDTVEIRGIRSPEQEEWQNLSAGVPVITSGLQKVSDGVPVNVRNSNP